MPSSASRPAANSETPSKTTDALTIFNGVVLQQSKRQMMSLMRSRTAATTQSVTPCTPLWWWRRALRAYRPGRTDTQVIAIPIQTMNAALATGR